MLKIINHFSTKLRNYITPDETVLEIPFDMAKKLNTLESGDHTYLSLVGYNGRAEIVKYTHGSDLKKGSITVERNVGGTGALNFPAGTCVTIDCNTVLMHEYVTGLALEVVQAELNKYQLTPKG